MQFWRSRIPTGFKATRLPVLPEKQRVAERIDTRSAHENMVVGGFSSFLTIV
jgi:hypothetical protein